jgi:hypothetical protein
MDPSKREFESRRLQLASQFETTMQQALPLVSVDPVAYAKVHVDPLVENFGFSTLPFAGLAGVDEILRQVIRDRPSVSHEAFGAFEDALGQGSEVAHIDVFSSYSPMSPLAFASLLQPMNNAWREAVAEGNTRSFWTNRRARPLTGSLAMSVTERRASAAGYVVGKITGRLRGTYEAMHNEPGNQWRTNPGMRSPERLKRLEIYSQVKHGWLPFPNPLLTPYEPGTFGGPTFLVDELPAILESHLLAIAECGFDTSFDPLLPYLELRRLFANVVQAQIAAEAVDVQGRAFDRSAGVGCLSEWIVDGTRPLGAPPANELLSDDGGLPFDLDTRAGRSAAALSYCEVSGDKFARAERADDGTADSVFSAFDRRPLMAWLAPDMVWACTEVAELVRKIHVPQRTKARPKMRAADGHVFISHASDDSVLATRLVEELENRGLPCWMAARGDVEAGQHYGAAILESIVASRAMVVLISTSALESPNVDREFSLAIDHRKPIVPIALSRDAISLESLPGQWHYYLATAQVRHFTNVSETATNIQAVVRELPGAARP